MLINVPEEIGKIILKKEKETYEVYSWQAACNSEVICYLDFLHEEGDVANNEVKEVKKRLIDSVWKDVDTSDVYEQVVDLVDEELEKIRKGE